MAIFLQHARLTATNNIHEALLALTMTDSIPTALIALAGPAVMTLLGRWTTAIFKR
jgi:hypothetical protein